MTRRLPFLALLLALQMQAVAQAPSLRPADRVRLAEAFRLAEAVQDSIWAGWSAAPFAVLLVAEAHEFLLRHPAPPDDFRRAGHDALLASDVYVRPAQFAPQMLAAFPLGGVPTIVVGAPEHTGKTSTAWVVTLLHEHFHQLQYSRPGYYEAANALDLARHDTTGMWMLNYPFPYDAEAVRDRVSAWQRAARAALDAAGTEPFEAWLAAYREARSALRPVLADADYRYLSFQVWQEGMARYTEYRVARSAAARYTPTDAFRALDDFTPFEEAADALHDGILKGLEADTLADQRRVAFYALGAAEALLLDAARPGWQARYFAEPFAPERYFEER